MMTPGEVSDAIRRIREAVATRVVGQDTAIEEARALVEPDADPDGLAAGRALARLSAAAPAEAGR